MRYLFIDESGDHNLNPKKIDPTFPLFVLTGIVFDQSDYRKFKSVWIRSKRQVFGTERVLLHSADLTRPGKSKQDKVKELTNAKLRAKFYKRVNSVLGNSKWELLAFVIYKPNFTKLFPEYPPDPYFLSFSYIISKFAEKLRRQEQGKIYVEQRNKILDRQFILAWKNAYASRVGLVTKKKLKEHKIQKPEIIRKSWNHAGLEIADMISYRISRQFLGKKSKPLGNEIDLKVIRGKTFDIAGLPDVPNPIGARK